MPPPTPESTPHPSLPNDLLLSCFARVSRLHYRTLSLVSKSFRSLITSPEINKTRSLLNLNESCLYVCLKFPLDPYPRWFTLCRKPDQTLTTKEKKNKKKKNKKKNKKKKKRSGYVLATTKCTPQAIKQKEFYCCEIENVMYFYLSGVFLWYDNKVRIWKEVKGVEGLPTFATSCAKLVDYGGKMAVLWDKGLRFSSNGYKKKVIWCAVIALEKRNNNEEIWVKVEWFDIVLTVPESYKFVCAFSTTV